jgi:hypothetical protein
LPAWFASTVHVPAPTIVTVEPDTVQTLVVAVLNVTASPEVALAETVNGASPKFLPPSAPKLIVWFAFDTVKDCDTCGAALKFALPAWFASMVQVPVPTIVTVEPSNVQTPVVAVLKLTPNPEEAVAVTVKGASPNVCAGNAPKVIVWFAFETLKDWVTCGAGPYVESPAWLAAIVHVPTPTIVTVVPDTVQTAVVSELNATVNPELAVALTVNGMSPNTLSGSGLKVIVCDWEATVKLRETCGAGLKLALPAWLASIVQVPAETIVTVDPETVQTLVVRVLKVTTSPELAVADTVNGGSPGSCWAAPRT